MTEAYDDVRRFTLVEEPAAPAWHPLLLAPFIALSSVLGLARVILNGGWVAFGRVWAASLAADAVFVLGSVVVAMVAYRLALRRRVALGIALGAALSWLVYWTSFLLVASRGAFPDPTPTQAWNSLGFVGAWGLAGLVFSAIAPPLVALRAAN